MHTPKGESLNSKAKNLTLNCLSATSFMYFGGRRNQWPMIHSGQWSSLSTIITGSLWWCSDILEIPMEDAIAEASTKCQPGCLHNGRISLYYSFPSPCHPPTSSQDETRSWIPGGFLPVHHWKLLVMRRRFGDPKGWCDCWSIDHMTWTSS